MQKTRIAVAALAVCSGVGAQGLSVYGVVDVGLVGQHVDEISYFLSAPTAHNKWNQTTLQSGLFSESRLGIAGTEDLGGGFKALYRVEASVEASSGEQGLGNLRQAYVGLQGDFGVLKVGQVFSAMHSIYGVNHSGFDSQLSASAGLLPVLYQHRLTDAVRWESETWGAFRWLASHTLGHQAGGDTVTDVVMQYANGPATFNIGFQGQNRGAPLKDRFTTALNGAYDFGSFKLLASYARRSDHDEKEEITQIGADIPMSVNTTLSLGHAQAHAENPNPMNGGWKEGKSSSVVVNHQLSKRTRVYAGYKQLSAKQHDAYQQSWINTQSNTYAVGMQHDF